RVRESDIDFTETRATGHNDFRPYAEGGVQVRTEGSTSTDKAAGYFEVNQPFAQIGEPSMAWTNNEETNTRPSVQLVVDIDGNGTPDGILVGERTYANGNPLYQDITTSTNWWLTNGSSQAFKDLAPSHDGGNGSTNNGTLTEWRGALPAEATVLKSGWSLGSGVKGDGDIESITVGTTTYEFKANRAPEASDASRAIAAGLTRSVRLAATDADGDALTYSVNGKELSGNKFTYKASTHFVGTKNFTYTADDGHGGTVDGTITVDVVKAKTRATIKVTPNLTTRKTVRVRMDLTTPARTVGTIVRVSVDGKAAGAGVISKNFVRITLGSKLTKGTHVIRAKYVGNDYSTPVKVGTTVQVR
ncbi:MAG: Ig-like domain-containing protein, partial [Nocardioidaceae bacterium]|nr:Ig-like domain-containing protein [Nocardioidaceae bacterium]